MLYFLFHRGERLPSGAGGNRSERERLPEAHQVMGAVWDLNEGLKCSKEVRVIRIYH